MKRGHRGDFATPMDHPGRLALLSRALPANVLSRSADSRRSREVSQASRKGLSGIFCVLSRSTGVLYVSWDLSAARASRVAHILSMLSGQDRHALQCRKRAHARKVGLVTPTFFAVITPGAPPGCPLGTPSVPPGCPRGIPGIFPGYFRPPAPTGPSAPNRYCLKLILTRNW